MFIDGIKFQQRRVIAAAFVPGMTQEEIARGGQMTPVVQVVDRQCTAYTHGGYGERCKKLARVNGLCTAHSKHNDIYREPRDPGPWADSRFIYVLGGDALVIKVGASVDPSSRLAQIKSGDSRFHA